jgi:phosphate butyryltransferase
MYQNYRQIIDKIRTLGRITLSVAVAQDKDVLAAVKLAWDAGIADAVLVGDERQIRPLMKEVGLPDDMPVVHEPDNNCAALQAVSMVSGGKAQVLMKGLINSSDFLRAALNKEVGLRTGRLLSHLAAFEIPDRDKLLFVTDGGMNIAPEVKEKKDILINAMAALRDMGIGKPYVALLTANETVNPKMPATVDAKALADMAKDGEFPEGVIEGPIALDVAVSSEAAKHKGLDSEVSGKVDLMLVPTIETGNALGKSIIYFAHGKMAGIILGATHPIVMTSRAETPEGKLNSIALACLIHSKK